MKKDEKGEENKEPEKLPEVVIKPKEEENKEKEKPPEEEKKKQIKN